MYPHERSLVARLANKPFALVGVNSDKDQAELKKVIEEEKITWRSFWDGGSSSGPIATKWRIQGWPTLFVLDAQGIIRHKFPGNPGDAILDKAIDELVKEADSGK